MDSGFQLSARHSISEKIQSIVLNKDDLSQVIKSLKLWGENVFFIPSKVFLNDNKLKKEVFLQGSVIKSRGIKFEVNEEQKIIRINQSQPDDFIVFSKVILDGWTINFLGIQNSVVEKKVNRTGITGCLNFFNTKFYAAKIYAKYGLCEDTLNIVSSTGHFVEY